MTTTNTATASTNVFDFSIDEYKDVECSSEEADEIASDQVARLRRAVLMSPLGTMDDFACIVDILGDAMRAVDAAEKAEARRHRILAESCAAGPALHDAHVKAWEAQRGNS